MFENYNCESSDALRVQCVGVDVSMLSFNADVDLLCARGDLDVPRSPEAGSVPQSAEGNPVSDPQLRSARDTACGQQPAEKLCPTLVLSPGIVYFFD